VPVVMGGTLYALSLNDVPSTDDRGFPSNQCSNVHKNPGECKPRPSKE
jgi:hypothetical protein